MEPASPLRQNGIFAAKAARGAIPLAVIILNENAAQEMTTALTAISTCEHPAYRPYPSKLFVEIASRCTLGCFMCVKQTGGLCLLLFAASARIGAL